MEEKTSHSSGRFQDPLGEYMKPFQTAKKQPVAQHLAVDEAYKGFYAGFEPCGKEGTSFLSSSQGIIGTELMLRPINELHQAESNLGFFAKDGCCIAVLERGLSDKLNDLLDKGWTVCCKLAYTMFVSERKAFSAKFACFCYGPGLGEEQKEALEAFVRNITNHCIASASNPELGLTQEQFGRVLESKGEWFYTKHMAWPELPRGTVYYRRRRTLNDRLIKAALEGGKGCAIASWVVAIVILAALAYAIWFFFFSS